MQSEQHSLINELKSGDQVLITSEVVRINESDIDVRLGYVDKDTRIAYIWTIPKDVFDQCFVDLKYA